MTNRERESLTAISKTIDAIHTLKYKMGIDTFNDPQMQEALGLLHGAQKLYRSEICANIDKSVALSQVNDRFVY